MDDAAELAAAGAQRSACQSLHPAIAGGARDASRILDGVFWAVGALAGCIKEPS